MMGINAEAVVLSYKLDRIRSHIERRLSVVDDITSSELKYVLKMISDFETVPAEWQLQKPFVVKEEDKK